MSGLECVRPNCHSPQACGGRQQGLCRKHYDACQTRGYVNGDYARSIMRELNRAGYTWKQIAAMAGITKSGLYLIRDTDRRVQRQTAIAFALLPRPDLFAGEGVLSAVGIHRRIHALQALGWTQRDLCARLGWGPRRLAMVLCRDRITCSVARHIADLYEELSSVSGPSAKTRYIATQKGWAPPLAWDDIDDPDEQPNFGEDCKVPFPERYLELRDHVGMKDDQIAEAMGIELESLERQLYRYDLFTGRAA